MPSCPESSSAPGPNARVLIASPPSLQFLTMKGRRRSRRFGAAIEHLLQGPTLDGSSQVQILREPIWSHLKANWILELNPSLHLGLGLHHELSFLAIYYFGGWFKSIDFPSKMVPCKFSLNLPLFGLGSNSSKGPSWVQFMTLIQ